MEEVGRPTKSRPWMLYRIASAGTGNPAKPEPKSKAEPVAGPYKTPDEALGMIGPCRHTKNGDVEAARYRAARLIEGTGTYEVCCP